MNRQEFLGGLISSALFLSVPKRKHNDGGYTFKKDTWFHVAFVYDKRFSSFLFKDKCRVKVYVSGKHVSTTYIPSGEEFGSLYMTTNPKDSGTLSLWVKLEKSMNLTDLMASGDSYPKFNFDNFATWDRALPTKDIKAVSDDINKNLLESSAKGDLTQWDRGADVTVLS